MDQSNVSELQRKVSKIEATFDILPRLEEKVDKITEIASKISAIEERFNHQSDAIERAFASIEKTQNNVERLNNIIIEHERSVRNKIEMTKNEIRIEQDNNTRNDTLIIQNLERKVEEISNDVKEKTSFVKGMIYTAGGLLTIVQAVVAFILMNYNDLIANNQETVNKILAIIDSIKA